MRIRAALVSLLAILGLVAIASPAQAGVKWNGKVVEVVETLPSSWPVSAAVNWLDTYTATDMRIVKKCSGKAWRCITIRPGRLTSGKKATAAGWSENSTVTIDTWKVANVKGWKGYYGYYTKRWLIAHELGHMFYLGHLQDCTTLMDNHGRCGWPLHVPPLRLNTHQRDRLKLY